MSLDAHIQAMAEKRQQIKQQIALESGRPMPDFQLITSLKKKNLMLKEEMQRYLKLKNTSAGQAS